MRKRILKIFIILFLMLIIPALYIVVYVVKYSHDEVDMCLDHGGCWDYTRDRCEMIEQGFCVQDKDECEVERNGIWNETEKFCKL